jgi:hypothetical protein
MYCAMRWDYSVTPLSKLIFGIVEVEGPGGSRCYLRPVDWGPNPDTDRVIDVCPYAFKLLGVKTDDVVSATLYI